MIGGTVTQVSIIVISLFIIPILLIAFRLNLFKSFSLGSFTKVFNRAFVIQFILGIFLLFASMFIGRSYNSNNSVSQLDTFYSLFLGSTYTYTVIGLFYYLPSLVLLNIITWLVIKFKSSSLKS
jgi:hypothetical protein